MDELDELLYFRVMRKSKPSYQVGGGLRWYGNWAFSCSHVLHSALKGVDQQGENWPVGQCIPIRLGISDLGEEKEAVAKVAYFGDVENEDIAILRLQHPETEKALANLPLNSLTRHAFQFFPMEGEQLEAYGSSGNIEGATNLGHRVSAICKGIVRFGFRQLDHKDPNIFIKNGFSGGPIFGKRKSRVAGIARARHTEQNVAYFIDIKVLHQAITQHFPETIKLLPEDDKSVKREEIANAITFFNREENIGGLRYLLNKYRYPVIPFVVKGKQSHWHSGLAKRLLFDHIENNDDCEPLKLAPIQVNWPATTGVFDSEFDNCLLELRKDAIDEYILSSDREINNKNWTKILVRGLRNEIAEGKENYKKKTISACNGDAYSPRLVVNYVIDKAKLSKFDKELMVQVCKDWCELRSEFSTLKTIILFSVVEDSAQVKVNWFKKMLCAKGNPACDHSVILDLQQTITQYSQTIEMQAEDKSYLIQKLKDVGVNDIETWSRLLQWERGYPESLTQDLSNFVKEITQSTGFVMESISRNFYQRVDDIARKHTR